MLALNIDPERMGKEPIQNVAELDEYVEAIDELRALAALIDSAVNEGKRVVKEYLRKNDMQRLETEKSSVLVATGTTRRFDSMTFHADHPKMYEKYTKETPTERVYITKKDAKKKGYGELV